jgi:hypothetical protein
MRNHRTNKEWHNPVVLKLENVEYNPLIEEMEE